MTIYEVCTKNIWEKKIIIDLNVNKEYNLVWYVIYSAKKVLKKQMNKSLWWLPMLLKLTIHKKKQQLKISRTMNIAIRNTVYQKIKQVLQHNCQNRNSLFDQLMIFMLKWWNRSVWSWWVILVVVWWNVWRIYVLLRKWLLIGCSDYCAVYTLFDYIYRNQNTRMNSYHYLFKFIVIGDSGTRCMR